MFTAGIEALEGAGVTCCYYMLVDCWLQPLLMLGEEATAVGYKVVGEDICLLVMP